jgi:hypothetical protein
MVRLGGSFGRWSFSSRDVDGWTSLREVGLGRAFEMMYDALIPFSTSFLLPYLSSRPIPWLPLRCRDMQLVLSIAMPVLDVSTFFSPDRRLGEVIDT